MEPSAISDLADPAEAWRRYSAAVVGNSLLGYARGEKTPIPPKAETEMVVAMLASLLDRQTRILSAKPAAVPDPVPYVPPGSAADMVLAGL